MTVFWWLVILGVLAGVCAIAARRSREGMPGSPGDAAPPVPIDPGEPSAPGTPAQPRPPELGRGLADTPAAGDILGQYQLLACVGEGGMGRVWAARSIGSALQRLVAVKTAIRDDEERIELRHLFMDEARIALLVRHPNVCGVHEFGEHDGVLYQVMEWCDGASLREVLDRLPEGRMDLPVAARILAKVSAGLHAAHELLDDDGVPMQVVHRDVSPQNILISTSGQVKVTDFGVAKAQGQLYRSLHDGEVKGKWSYMAPEQILGREIDRRADIFALGCILFEATTGQGPFARDGSPASLVRMLSRAPRSPLSLIPDYPEELAAIVLRALAKEPADRYATAEQLAVALESWLAAKALVVTERTLAQMMTVAVGGFTGEKAARIDQALLSLAAPASSVAAVLIMPAPATSEPARPTIPARPAGALRTSLPVRPSVAARPTLPAGPAARKPGPPR
jgi:serine/threonine protein kinase